MAQLTGTTDTSSANVDLTAIGTGDWIHWTTVSPTGTQRKATGGSQISDYTVGSESFNGAFDPSTLSWTDGTPTASGSDTAVVYNTTSGTEFTFTIGADTTLKHAHFYFGALGSGCVFTATLSDSSAGPYTATSAGVGDFNIHLDWSAGSGGQTLTVVYATGSFPIIRGIALEASAPAAPTGNALFFGAGV